MLIYWRYLSLSFKKPISSTVDLRPSFRPSSYGELEALEAEDLPTDPTPLEAMSWLSIGDDL